MSYDNLKLDKSFYSSNDGFLKTLNKLDTDENYKGTSLENTTAFQRQLKRFDIKVAGRNSDLVEKFFQTSESSALFPEFIANAVRAGVEENDILPDIVAVRTDINGLDYRSLTSEPSDSDMELKTVTEGSFIPETKITTKENLVKLQKSGRMLVSSYEAVRTQRLDVFSVMLRQIGAYIAVSKAKSAVNTLIFGDGNENPAPDIYAENNFKYSDLINLFTHMRPYKLTSIIVSPSTAAAVLNIDEFKDAHSGFDFTSTGKMITPFGAKMIISSSVSDNVILGIDSSCALEEVDSGSITTEYDKLISRQLERTAITATYGFSKLFSGAAVKLLLA